MEIQGIGERRGVMMGPRFCVTARWDVEAIGNLLKTVFPPLLTTMDGSINRLLAIESVMPVLD